MAQLWDTARPRAQCPQAGHSLSGGQAGHAARGTGVAHVPVVVSGQRNAAPWEGVGTEASQVSNVPAGTGPARRGRLEPRPPRPPVPRRRHLRGRTQLPFPSTGRPFPGAPGSLAAPAFLPPRSGQGRREQKADQARPAPARQPWNAVRAPFPAWRPPPSLTCLKLLLRPPPPHLLAAPSSRPPGLREGRPGVRPWPATGTWPPALRAVSPTDFRPLPPAPGQRPPVSISDHQARDGSWPSPPRERGTAGWVGRALSPP